MTANKQYGWIGPAPHVGEFETSEEHGGTWLTCIACGAQWSIAGGDELEQVSDGDGHCEGES
jgi:hypothetical protein